LFLSMFLESGLVWTVWPCGLYLDNYLFF
jgi:hypothetical protein